MAEALTVWWRPGRVGVGLASQQQGCPCIYFMHTQHA